MQNYNASVIFVKDPKGAPVQPSHMKVDTYSFSYPSNLPKGSLHLKNLFLSLDPYMRGRMNTKNKGYFLPPFTPGKVIETGGVSEVVAGERGGIKAGDIVSCFPVGLEKYSIIPAEVPVEKIDTSRKQPVSYYLGVLGVPGVTAYYGLSLGDPKPGESIYVSAAAGAVGQIVCQIAKLKGLYVIGSAGSNKKVQLLLSQFGCDVAFNYKNVTSVQQALSELAPDGLNIYFDNVGGEHLDAALGCMRNKGRIIACGMISHYNGGSYGYKNLSSIVFKELTITGFIVSSKLADVEYMNKFREEMVGWLESGKVTCMEHVVNGVENAPEAFVGLFKGVNLGKMIIKVAESGPVPLAKGA